MVYPWESRSVDDPAETLEGDSGVTETENSAISGPQRVISGGVVYRWCLLSPIDFSPQRDGYCWRRPRAEVHLAHI